MDAPFPKFLHNLGAQPPLSTRMRRRRWVSGMGPSRLVLLLSFFVMVAMLPAGESDLAADRVTLLELRRVVGGRTFLWNVSQASPCAWAGVLCEKNRVTALRLPGCSLTGTIPAGTIGNLTELRVLSLRMNALEGPLPSDLGSCANLRNIYLHGNAFSGEIPASLFSLTNLVRLNLAANNLSGEISEDFNKLTRLKTLYLQENGLSGPIPDLTLKLDLFNVSFNQLKGEVPAALRSMPTSAFSGNSLCGKPLTSCSGDSDIIVPKNEKKHKLSGGAIAGIVIGSVVGFVLILIILFLLCGKKRGKKTSAVDVAAVKHSEVEIPGEKPIGEVENGNGYSVAAAAAAAMAGNGSAKGDMSNGGAKKLVFFGNAAKVFDLEDLLRASAEVLGKGTFGTAYKAILEMGIVVAVKRLKDVTISEKEFREKIEGVGAMEHEHLVPLRAYYYSRDEKLLVYDYMPMGSLSALLHGEHFIYSTLLCFPVINYIFLLLNGYYFTSTMFDDELL